jgi:predicted phage terminase large subunit-like protein
MGKSKLKKKPVTRAEFREMAAAATEAIQQLRAAAQIASEEIAAGRAAFSEKDGTREERLARTRISAIEFGRTYLPHYFEQPSAEFHSALDKLITGDYTEEDLNRWREEFGIEIHEGEPELRLLAVMIPRGFGKSVLVNLCDNLRRICHGLDPYIILGSDTYEQASSQLEDIKDELENNEKIKADFGSLKPDRGVWREAELIQRKDGRVTWREGRIITTNRVRCDAVGRGGKMRGRRYGRQRPTVFNGDDVDNDESVVTKEQRDKTWNWLMSAVMPALDPQRGRLRIVGTNINHDCSIARAQRKTDAQGKRLFTSIKFAAMRRNADGEWESTWPERFTITRLMAIRELLGPTKFGAEYMNDPRDPDTALFNLDRLIFYSPVELQGKSLKHICYVDPSKGKKGKGRKKSDFSSFIETYFDQEKRITYLVDATRKRLTPNASRGKILEWFPRIVQSDQSAELTVEENSFGDILGAEFQDDLRAVGIDKVVHTLLHTEEKSARLERLSIRIENGGVRFPQKWQDENRRPEWFSEMEDYPGPYDDTIDGIESADSIGSRSVPAASAGKDPEGQTSRERMQANKDSRWLAKLLGFGRRAA